MTRFVPVILCIAALSVASCKKNNTNNDAQNQTNTTAPQLNIAYVNMDSVYARLEYFQEIKEELKKMENNMSAELQGIQRSIINTQNNLQNRIKNKDISEVEMAEFEKKLTNLNNSLQKKSESLSAQLMEKQSVMAMEIDELTTAFFKEYNANKGFNLILANNQVKTVYYADDNLDITEEVSTAFNEYVAKIKRNMVVNKTLGSLNKDNPKDTTSTQKTAE